MSGQADAEAAARRATDTQVFDDAERLIADRKERQTRRMPLPFAPTIGAALAARYWFLGIRPWDRRRRYSRTLWAIPIRRSSYGATAEGRR